LAQLEFHEASSKSGFLLSIFVRQRRVYAGIG